ncbi:MAG: GtrA family protein [Spirochaetota bacterium]
MFDKIFLKKSDNTLVHLLRSVISSNIAFCLDVGVLVLLTEVAGIYYLISNLISFVAGGSISYILSVWWVFNKRTLNSKHLEYVIFISIGTAGLGLNELMLWSLTEHINIFYIYSKIIAGSTIFFFNFFLRKYVLFR